MTIDEQKALSEKNEAFSKWMAEPLVRMSLSFIPAGEHKDALQNVLRSAFDAGYSCGQGAMALRFMHAMLSRNPKDRS